VPITQVSTPQNATAARQTSSRQAEFGFAIVAHAYSVSEKAGGRKKKAGAEYDYAQRGGWA
jgi:hypothetical protein